MAQMTYDAFLKDVTKDGIAFRTHKDAYGDAVEGIKTVGATTARKFAVAVEAGALPVSTDRKAEASPKFVEAFKSFRFKSGKASNDSDTPLQSKFKTISVAALHRMTAERKFSATLDLVAARVAAIKAAKDAGTDKNAPSAKTLLEAFYTAAGLQNANVDRDLTVDEIDTAAKKPIKDKKLNDMLKTVANAFKPLVGDKRPAFVDAATLVKLNEALAIVNELAEPDVAAKDAEIAALKAQLAAATTPAPTSAKRREKASA